MAQIEYYKKQILKKKEELSKLNISLAQEQTKITSQEKRIISAKAAIGRTKNQSTVKSKLNEIDRANKNIAYIRKKWGRFKQKLQKLRKK